MAKYKIPISRPNLTADDFIEIKKCFDSTWISSKSPWVDKFESEFAKKVSGTKYAVSVNSGTSALFLALKALGIGPGDEVIIPTLTMIATVNAVSLTGAKSVVVDSRSRDDWNIDPSQIEKKITPKTKAILPVHLYGYSCEMEEITRIAKKHHIFVVEDAAEAMGALYRGKQVGGLGDVSCFSLYANKIMTTGNGGMVATCFFMAWLLAIIAGNQKFGWEYAGGSINLTFLLDRFFLYQAKTCRLFAINFSNRLVWDNPRAA